MASLTSGKQAGTSGLSTEMCIRFTCSPVEAGGALILRLARCSCVRLRSKLVKPRYTYMAERNLLMLLAPCQGIMCGASSVTFYANANQNASLLLRLGPRAHPLTLRWTKPAMPARRRSLPRCGLLLDDVHPRKIQADTRNVPRA